MRKPAKPLTIFVHPDYGETAWVKDLQAHGHTVMSPVGLWNADLILGPNCARFLPGMEPFLASFIKGVWAVKVQGKQDD